MSGRVRRAARPRSGHAAGEPPALADAEADRLPSANCADEDWPYLAGPCLPGAAPARVIAISGDNATILVR